MNVSTRSVIIALLAGLPWLAIPCGTAMGGPLIADSVMHFSGTQGLNNWSYGYYDGDSPSPYTPGDFEQFPLFDGTKWLIQDGPGGYWTQVTATGGHPNGIITTFGRQSADHWAVRRWTSIGQALHTISGFLADDNPAINLPGAYNGVVGHIFVDGTEVLTLLIDEGGSVNYSLTVPLNAGSIVDFAIDAKKYLNQDRTADWTDTTTFTAQIFVPEPSSVRLVGILCFGLALTVSSPRAAPRMLRRVRHERAKSGG